MNRREFVRAAAHTAAASVFSQGMIGQITVGHGTDVSFAVRGFHLSETRGSWSVQFDPLKAAGLIFPAGSWQWVALNFAQGTFSMIGGQIISALVGALARANQPDIADLMRQQLNAFAQLLQQAFDQNNLRTAENQLVADLHLAKVYALTSRGAQGIYDGLIRSIFTQMQNLDSLGYVGYRTYIQYAGLQLALMQDSAAYGQGDATLFREAQHDLQKYQNKMIETIRAQTEPASHFGNECDSNCAFYEPHVMLKSGFVLGYPFSGYVPVFLRNNNQWFARSADDIHAHNLEVEGKNLPPKQGHWYDWLELRKQIMADSTDWGDPIVKRLVASRPVLLSRATRLLRTRSAGPAPRA